MAYTIRRAEYFYATVQDEPGEGYRLLSALAEVGVNLLAFTGTLVGPMRVQLTIFPDDPSKMMDAAKKAGLGLDGPHLALMVQGDDELGAIARIHLRLNQARVNAYASSGLADGRGSFGYILYVRPEDYESAARALGV